MTSPVRAARRPCKGLQNISLRAARPPVFVTLAAVLIAACSYSAPTHFYTLDSEPPGAIPAAAVASAPIRVLAVRMPAALDRLEVTREATAASVQVNDLDRWSAPVGELARTALSQDLADRLPNLAILPARATAPVHTRDLTVEVLSLRSLGDRYALDAHVEVVEAATGVLLDAHTWRLATASSGNDAAAEAQALSRLLASLADALSLRLATLADTAR
jgi:uncharacterized protein